MIKIKYETTNENFNWKISITGMIFIVLRFWFMTSFATTVDGELYYFPEVLHASYWISLLMALSMIFSFRFKPLNVIALGILPSVFVTIFAHDIPILMDPQATSWAIANGNTAFYAIGGVFWWNVLTTHLPIPFVALYMIITRKETLSKAAFLLNIPVIMGWFWFLDDKQNGTAVSGDMYIIAALLMLFIWTPFYIFIICWDVKNVDPLVAKVVHLKGIEWNSKVKSTNTSLTSQEAITPNLQK